MSAARMFHSADVGMLYLLRGLHGISWHALDFQAVDSTLEDGTKLSLILLLVLLLLLLLLKARAVSP